MPHYFAADDADIFRLFHMLLFDDATPFDRFTTPLVTLYDDADAAAIKMHVVAMPRYYRCLMLMMPMIFDA